MSTTVSPVTHTADVAVKSAVRNGALPSPAREAGSISRPVPSTMTRRKASGTSRAGCWSVRGNAVPFIPEADGVPALFRHSDGLQFGLSASLPALVFRRLAQLGAGVLRVRPAPPCGCFGGTQRQALGATQSLVVVRIAPHACVSSFPLDGPRLEDALKQLDGARGRADAMGNAWSDITDLFSAWQIRLPQALRQLALDRAAANSIERGLWVQRRGAPCPHSGCRARPADDRNGRRAASYRPKAACPLQERQGVKADAVLPAGTDPSRPTPRRQFRRMPGRHCSPGSQAVRTATPSRIASTKPSR